MPRALRWSRGGGLFGWPTFIRDSNQGLGLRDEGLGFGLGFGVWRLGFRVCRRGCPLLQSGGLGVAFFPNLGVRVPTALGFCCGVLREG